MSLLTCGERRLRQNPGFAVHDGPVAHGLRPVKLDDSPADGFRWQRVGCCAVGPGAFGGYVHEGQERGELVGRRVAGGVQQRGEAIGESQSIICHVSTLAPGEEAASAI
jgi:hypothetical protein